MILMKGNIGYTNAVNLGKEALEKLDPQEVCANSGVMWDDGEYIIPWMGESVRFNDGKIEEQIIWYHYLTAKGPRDMKGGYITYKQVPGGAIYNDNFIKRAVKPMVKAFSYDLDGFLKRGEMMGGWQIPMGHMAFTLKLLPYVPLTYVIWQGDDEVPASGNILYDETAPEWLCAEDLVVVASLPVYKMFGMKV